MMMSVPPSSFWLHSPPPWVRVTAALLGLMIASWVAALAEPPHSDNEQSDSLRGKRLPRLEAEALDETLVVLPDSARGCAALVGMGFSHDAQQAVEAWTEPACSAYGSHPRFRRYVVPMMGRGLVRRFRGMINDRMRKAVADERRATILPYYEDVDAYLALLGLRESPELLILLLDAEGQILWSIREQATYAGSRTLHDRIKQALQEDP